MKHILLPVLFCGVLPLCAASVSYPAEGNIDFEEGTLELWLSPEFDPRTPPQKGLEMPATVFQLDFPGNAYENHFVLRFWKKKLNTGGNMSALRASLWENGRGKGGPEIPVQTWKKGEVHHIGMSWCQNTVTMYCDGKITWKGPFAFPKDMDLSQVWILVGSRALWWQKGREPVRESFLPSEENPVRILAVKISADCRDLTQKSEPVRDRLTLLLDCFKEADSAAGVTHPAVISGRGRPFGKITGGFRITGDGIYLFNREGKQ